MARRQQPREQAGTKTGGQWERVYTADTLQAGINEYLTDCDTKGIVPLWEELLPRLGISRDTWDRYRDPQFTEQQKQNPDETTLDKMRTARIVKNTEMVLGGGLIRGVLQNQKTSAIGIFLLKQKHYGGYTDAQQVERNVDIKIKVEGCGEGAAD